MVNSIAMAIKKQIFQKTIKISMKLYIKKFPKQTFKMLFWEFEKFNNFIFYFNLKLPLLLKLLFNNSHIHFFHLFIG